MLYIEIDKSSFVTKMMENLPVLRAKLGCSQEDLAAIAGISRYTVMAAENRQRQMAWNTFLALITVFNSHQDTKNLMEAMGIYTQDLQRYLGQSRYLKKHAYS